MEQGNLVRLVAALHKRVHEVLEPDAAIAKLILKIQQGRIPAGAGQRTDAE